MKIDDKVEKQVRAVLDALVHRDPDRLDRAMSNIAAGRQLQAALELSVAICGFVLFETHDGAPEPVDIDEIAGDLESQERWLEVEKAEVVAFLTALVDRRPLSEVLPRDSAVVLPFVVAANLLATSSAPEEGEWWFNYLDKVEAAIEAAG
ncbi:hypothetical protein [Micromonospora endophytica]|uniref:Uncharacterized protein n=1 Tax=Micromonospora endophytica TaxID=515350 RepID=A0A2W2CYF6_9ACTN|nr:hypothetical protein [Micromonospora endophytica]PZF90076.1 hypothetical protein C1I93_23210 [Micromonospora endophytica]RIW41599.1 hypothetical protein D3H59_25670 [Micromonospora endophytica]BCJ61229.1 hypothetical protein Jiend_46510 [Micromonospora endophytica]